MLSSPFTLDEGRLPRLPSTRLGPAIIHLLQFYTVVLSILGVGLPFVPVVVVLVFPFITAGFFIKDGRGLPKRWHRLPYSLPTTIFVDIPVGSVFFVLSAFSIIVFHPAAHVVMALLHCPRSPGTPPPTIAFLRRLLYCTGDRQRPVYNAQSGANTAA